MWISKKKYEFYREKMGELEYLKEKLEELNEDLNNAEKEKHIANITCTGCEYLITDERNTIYGKERQFYCSLNNKCPDFK